MRDGGGGAVVNIASHAGFSAHSDPAYTASKWALRGLTRTAAMEFATWGIRVNSVCPGLVVTELNAGDCIQFSVGSRPARILRLQPQGFYERARRKLQLTDSSELAPQ